MVHLLGLVIIIGLADSANPSTLAPALYLAVGDRAIRSLAGFIAGVVGVNFLAGLLLMIGPGQALFAFVPRPDRHARQVLELGLGLGLFALALGLWRARARVAFHVAKNRYRVDRASFLVGGGIMLVELPTALPYFAVIAAIIASGKHLLAQVVFLGVFNLTFISPLLLILLLRSLANDSQIVPITTAMTDHIAITSFTCFACPIDSGTARLRGPKAGPIRHPV